MHIPDDVQSWLRETLHLSTSGIEALPVEASTRSFFRLLMEASAAEVLEPEGSNPELLSATAAHSADKPQTAIVMVSPPATENNRAFVQLAGVFESRGIHVPTIYAVDEHRGFFLMEDLGKRQLREFYGTPDETRVLRAAIDVLVRLQGARASTFAPYTTERLHDELTIFEHWLVERLVDASVPRALLDSVRGVLVAAISEMPAKPLHRDFHCLNLLWDGHRVGVVDFQDALLGCAAYDIASLLRDCYYTFDEDTVAALREEFRVRALPEVAAAPFARAFDFAAIQRQLKAVGIFARLELRDQKPSHLGNILPVLGRIRRLAQSYDELEELAAWLARDIEPRARRVLAP